MQGMMKRNPPDYYDDLQQLYFSNEMGKRSGLDHGQLPKEQKMKNQLQHLAGLEKRRRQKSKQQKMAEKYYSSIF